SLLSFLLSLLQLADFPIDAFYSGNSFGKAYKVIPLLPSLGSYSNFLLRISHALSLIFTSRLITPPVFYCISQRSTDSGPATCIVAIFGSLRFASQSSRSPVVGVMIREFSPTRFPSREAHIKKGAMSTAL